MLVHVQLHSHYPKNLDQQEASVPDALVSCCLQSRLDSSRLAVKPVEFCTFVPTHLQVPDVSPSKRHGIKLLTVPEKHHVTDCLWQATLGFDRHGNMNTQ